MKAEEEIRAYLKKLQECPSNSTNMNYKMRGATDALEWVLDEKDSKPYIGYR